jgi:FkbM family methyltransferase
MKIRETSHGQFIYPENDNTIGEALDDFGEVNLAENEFLTNLVNVGDVAIDVGANIGIASIPLAKKVGPAGYVLALEAHSTLFHALCGNLALNDITHVQAFNRAAGEKTGALFYFPKLDLSKPGDYFGIKLAGLLNARDDQDRNYDNPVSVIAVDDLGIATPKLVRISVNGMEMAVLHGMKKTLERAKPYLYINFARNQDLILKYLANVEYEWKLHEPKRISDEADVSVNKSIICWHKTKKLEVEDKYLIDLDASEAHAEIRKLRDNLHDSDFRIC